ncbi:polyprenyl synthetase family protein [Prolixibacteraceae bacterium JC049]|nr:polyprenyl synthetase family protein [Prolixibacteraceae bacterium JC049]
MAPLDRIKAPIKDELDAFEPHFRSTVKTDVPLLATVMNYILRRKGKQMRPMFVFLSAKLNGGITEETYVGASFIELLHTATLIHDDVVDETYERRGTFSVNALWKNKIAVLAGDYILARGLLLAVKHKAYQLLELMSQTVEDMSKGEILQIQKARKLDITEETYFEIIRKKTASLIATSMAIGAASTTKDEATISKMYQLGEHIGIAFQIRDDIFDYQSKGLIGKPTGNDIKERKMTLPLIHVLNQSSKADKKHYIHLVRKKNKNKAKVKEVIDFVISNGGLEYATSQMNEYRDKALSILDEFPETETRESLRELILYATERKH